VRIPHCKHGKSQGIGNDGAIFRNGVENKCHGLLYTSIVSAARAICKILSRKGCPAASIGISSKLPQRPRLRDKPVVL
jgi:hypothetical protein